MISNAQVNTAHGTVVDEMHERMRELSADMSTVIRRKGYNLVIEVN